ncbi:MAG: hypothetical protein NZM25_04300 [Leptospiraceae bacterium]|nr:hypothetical protein [Leptospiraceae bacterium]MDW8305765.1 hypothetical protein [Leptospiraceae bacterium]
MKIRALVQARTSSKRLPLKVLLPIGEYLLLEHIFLRLAQIKKNNLEVALAIPQGDEKLIRFSQEKGLTYYEGDEFDVLARFLHASSDLDDHDFVVRLTGDNPFLDYGSLAEILETLETIHADYIYPRGLPLGMGFEIIRVAALRAQKFYELEDHHKEHVTTFIKEKRHLFEIVPLGFGPLYHPEIDQIEEIPLRLTVDEEKDLEMARKLYTHFAALKNPLFRAQEVVELYRRYPHFFSVNRDVRQKSPREAERS